MKVHIGISLFVILLLNAVGAAAQFHCPIATCRLNANQTPCLLFVCPKGDTPSFADQGWSLDIWVWDVNHNPIPGIPAFDFWFIDCAPLSDVSLCGGSASTHADANTDANGKTTMSTATLIGGGCADGMALVIQGIVVPDSLTNCTTDKCFPIWLRSPDINGDLVVNLVDLSIFAAAFPPMLYERCSDMNIDGTVDLIDLSKFAFHFPGHEC